MVHRELFARKVATAAGRLNDADDVFSRPWEELRTDYRSRDLGTFYLFLAIQECIDMATHWVAEAGWPPPDDVGSTFDLLAERGVIDSSSADDMRAAVGLRNRIAHGYGSVDHARVHGEFRAGVAGLRRFLATMAAAARTP